MITREYIIKLLDGFLPEQKIFLVDLKILKDNKISVYIDNIEGVTLDQCAEVSKQLEKELDSDVEDFSIEVSSPGLDKPLKLPFQYFKNIGREIDVLKNDGVKYHGILRDFKDSHINLEYDILEKDNSSGKKKTVKKSIDIELNDIKTAKIVVSLKNN